MVRSVIYRDYCSDMSSFIVVGGASDEQQRFTDVARSVHFKTLDCIRPGITARDVMQFVRQAYRDSGFDWNFDIGRCGHGIGLELAEQPSLDDNSNVVLQSGMTLAFEPAILADHGVYDMEEDLVVTDIGCAVLAEVWPR